MSVERIGVDPAEPAVRSEGLRAFVDAARSQPSVRVKVDAATVIAAWAEQRARRRNAIGLAVAAGLGALAIGSWAVRQPAATPEPAAVAQGVEEAPANPVPAPTEAIRPDREEPRAPEPVVLAASVHVDAVGDELEPRYEVRGPLALTLQAGSAQLTVDEGAGPLLVTVPDGQLEIHTGVTIVQLAGSVSTVVVETGVTYRIERDGTRRELRPAEATEALDSAKPSASTLARLAEQRLAEGDSRGAIKHLRVLVTEYPKSGPARTALIDLGRLLRASGQEAAARCAYREFLARYPGSSLAAEVERALAKLPEAGDCRGINPR